MSYRTVIGKKNWFEFRNIVKDISENTQKDMKMSSSPISMEECLICLLRFPKRKIRKRAEKLMGAYYPQRLNGNGAFRLAENEKDFQRDFLVHTLITNSSILYYKIKKIIEHNFDTFRFNLIKALVDMTEAVQKNALQMLQDLEPVKFGGKDYYEVLGTVLDEKEKNRLFSILKKRIQEKKIIMEHWTARESFIRSVGALNYKLAGDLLARFLKDSNSNCRWTLARVLGNIRTNQSIRNLTTLLMDEENSVQMTATESIKKLMPGLYGNLSSLDILLKIGEDNPIELFNLMPKDMVNIQAKRTWGRLGYNFEIIQSERDTRLLDLIQKYHKQATSGTSQEVINSLFLILKTKMPKTLRFLDKMAEKEGDPVKKKKHLDLIYKIEQEYQIENKKGFSIIL